MCGHAVTLSCVSHVSPHLPLCACTPDYHFGFDYGHDVHDGHGLALLIIIIMMMLIMIVLIMVSMFMNHDYCGFHDEHDVNDGHDHHVSHVSPHLRLCVCTPHYQDDGFGDDLDTHTDYTA